MNEWIAANDLDTYKSTNWYWELPGFRKFHLEIRDGAHLPRWFSPTLYVVVSLIGFSWFFRTAMGSVCGRRRENIKKVGL